MATNSALDFSSILNKIIETYAPGGSVETAGLADVEAQGKALSSKLNASAVSRGLGNALTGIPTTVANQVSKGRQSVQSSVGSQYLQGLMSLAGLAAQKEQSDAQLKLQQQQLALQQSQYANSLSGSSAGLDAFGQPMTGTLAAAQLEALTQGSSTGTSSTGTSSTSLTPTNLFGNTSTASLYWPLNESASTYDSSDYSWNNIGW
jgi:hypothetical protein